MRSSSGRRRVAVSVATLVLIVGGASRATAQQPDSARVLQTDSSAHAATDSAAKKKKTGGLLGKFGKHKETIAKAALAATGVGAVAMLAKPGSATNPAAAMASAMSGAIAPGQAYGAPPAGPPVGGKRFGAGMSTSDPRVRQMQQDLTTLSVRVTSGDTVAARQYLRFQREMMAGGMTNSDDPIARMRTAYDCAMTGAGCRAPER